MDNIILTIGSSHIKNINHASTRRIRKMTNSAINQAYDRAISQNAKPISAVDDISMNKIGPWINNFAKCLARSAKSKNISICGGEIAQMSNTYHPNAVSFVVTLVSIK